MYASLLLLVHLVMNCWCSGNLVMKGYLKNEEETEKCFAGGWFHSGDVAVCNPDG